MTAYAIDRRLSKVDFSLGVRESPMLREQREELTRWLLADDQAADLVADLEAMVGDYGSMPGILARRTGRDLILSMIASLYWHEEPVTCSGTFDQASFATFLPGPSCVGLVAFGTFLLANVTSVSV